MMVAATILQRDDRNDQVYLFEKNKSLWAKVIISGWWRCNLTTWYTRRQDLKKAYIRGRDFFETSLKKFTPRSVKNRFIWQWIPCKTEEDMRVFPVSDNWQDVVDMFNGIFKSKDISIYYKQTVQAIEKIWSSYKISTNSWEYHVDKVVLTTWWNAFSHTWSSGDWYHFASSLGHNITQLGPSLNSFVTQEDRLYILSWLSFSEASVHLTASNTKHKLSGPILITHFGISGPLAFIVAAQSAFQEVSATHPVNIRLQPLSEMNSDQWNDYLLQQSLASKKECMTILSNKLPKRFSEALLKHLEIPSNKSVSQLTKKERVQLSNYLWSWIPLNLIKRRPWDEFVTAGWVDTSEIYAKTLESKISPWLYFAWEILNIDWVTGGYNLQMCWSTWRSVGLNV